MKLIFVLLGLVAVASAFPQGSPEPDEGIVEFLTPVDEPIAEEPIDEEPIADPELIEEEPIAEEEPIDEETIADPEPIAEPEQTDEEIADPEPIDDEPTDEEIAEPEPIAEEESNESDQEVSAESNEESAQEESTEDETFTMNILPFTGRPFRPPFFGGRPPFGGGFHGQRPQFNQIFPVPPQGMFKPQHQHQQGPPQEGF